MKPPFSYFLFLFLPNFGTMFTTIQVQSITKKENVVVCEGVHTVFQVCVNVV